MGMARTSGEYLRWYSRRIGSMIFGMRAEAPAAFSASLSSLGTTSPSVWHVGGPLPHGRHRQVTAVRVVRWLLWAHDAVRRDAHRGAPRQLGLVRAAVVVVHLLRRGRAAHRGDAQAVPHR